MIRSRTADKAHAGRDGRDRLSRAEQSFFWRRSVKGAALIAMATMSAGLTAGCASLTNNVTQPIVVTTVCGEQPIQGASCRVINANGAWNVPSTPGSVMVRRAPSDMAIDCKMNRSQATPVLTESYANRGVWGNIIAGGLIGFTVDTWRDAAWKYDPVYVVDLCRDASPESVKSIQTGMPEASRSPAGGMVSNLSGEMRYALTAESVAKQRSCAANPHAVLNARGPATEVYTVACNNGDALMLKCVYGTCTAI